MLLRLEDLPFIQYKKSSFVKKKTIKEKSIRQFFADMKMEKIKSRRQLRRNCRMPTWIKKAVTIVFSIVSLKYPNKAFLVSMLMFFFVLDETLPFDEFESADFE